MHYVFHFVEDFDRLWKFVFRWNFPMEFPIVMYHLKWIIDNFPENLFERNDSTGAAIETIQLFFASRTSKEES